MGGWSDMLVVGTSEGKRWRMGRMVLQWVLNAVALWIVSRYVSGFVIGDWLSAMIAVVMIGLFNATFGLLLKIITLPLGILSFGLFFLVINAVMLKFASEFVPGFRVETFKAAFLGALALAVLHLVFGFLTPKRRRVDYRAED
jgi:putative membrane protein